MNPEASATKADIERLEHLLDEKVEQLRAEMQHGYRDLAERITDS